MADDPRRPGDIAEDIGRANTYSESGSLKHAMLSLGFSPASDEAALGMLRRIVRENEESRSEIDSHRRMIRGLGRELCRRPNTSAGWWNDESLCGIVREIRDHLGESNLYGG